MSRTMPASRTPLVDVGLGQERGDLVDSRVDPVAP